MKIYALAMLLGATLGLAVACGGNKNTSKQGAVGTQANGAGAGAGIATTSAGAACAVGQGNDGGGASVKIGSKAFAEEELLATMTKLVLEKHGFKVDYTTKAADPAIDQALRSGTIDMLWQYTGTELQQFLKVDQPPTDLTAAFSLAKEKDAANGLCWVAPAPLDDTNGIAIKSSDKGKYGSTLSEFGQYLQKNPSTAVCIMSEFRTRPDGLPGLQKTYGSYNGSGFKDIGSTAEAAIAKGDCVAGEVFTTDFAIAANNRSVPTDDNKLFPPDN
ncbi:MAG: glycine betaine ABC transporter substrate-binding protein, partial [Dehalococcoidia bacterium]